MFEMLGTPVYTAPEVIFGKYNEKCDIWSIGVILYVMLSGVFPFLGRGDESIIVKVKKASVSFNGKPWENVSKEGIAFVKALMERDPDSRLSAQKALHHPWIERNANKDELDVEKAQSALNNLKNFHKNVKLQTAALTFIVT